jgi:hypothetical protein
MSDLQNKLSDSGLDQKGRAAFLSAFNKSYQDIFFSRENRQQRIGYISLNEKPVVE